MHASIEALLALRDGEPVAAEHRIHVTECAECRSRLADLNSTRDALAALPVISPPADRWSAIQAITRTRTPQQREHRALSRYAGPAIAAGLLLTAALVAERLFIDATGPDTLAGNDTITQIPQVQMDEAELAALIAYSGQLDDTLRAMPRRPVVVRAGTADTIAGLQQGVALIDHRLSLGATELPPDISRQLWRQRVELMNSLVTVRYAETPRAALLSEFQ